jgi:hypothetical protein
MKALKATGLALLILLVLTVVLRVVVARRDQSARAQLLEEVAQDLPIGSNERTPYLTRGFERSPHDNTPCQARGYPFYDIPSSHEAYVRHASGASRCWSGDHSRFTRPSPDHQHTDLSACDGRGSTRRGRPSSDRCAALNSRASPALRTIAFPKGQSRKRLDHRTLNNTARPRRPHRCAIGRRLPLAEMRQRPR